MIRALVLSLTIAVVVGTSPPDFTAQGARALSGFLTEAVSQGDVPGVVVLVLAPNRVLYHEAFGKMDVAHDVQMLLVVRSWIGPYLQPWSRSFPS